MSQKQQSQPGRAGNDALLQKFLTDYSRSSIFPLIQKFVEDATRQGGTAILNIGTDTPWVTDDRQWFQQRPQRSFRIRPVHTGEWLDTRCTHVLIKQTVPGMRKKVHFKAFDRGFKNGNLLSTYDNDDYLLWCWCSFKGLPFPTQSAKGALPC
jgi:hypothetical protein